MPSLTFEEIERTESGRVDELRSGARSLLLVLAILLLLQGSGMAQPGDTSTTATAESGPHSAREKDPPPTIVLMISDDQHYADFGFAGNPHAHTPAIDRLVAEGALFPVAHVGMSRCRPSMACLLTGRYPHQHGVYYNTRGHELPNSMNTLPELLSKAGYLCWIGGKYWEGDPGRLGFVERDRAIVRTSQRRLEKFLESAAGKPVFIWWAPSLPHYPFNAPPEYLDKVTSESLERPSFVPREEDEEWRKSQGRLLANVAWLDDGVRRLRAILHRQGRIENTLMVFLIDNGFVYGIPSKGSPREAGFRTPVILWDRGRIPGGTRFDHLVSTLDVIPTLLDWAGIDTPSDFTGRSLWPLLEGKEARWRDTLYGAVYGSGPSDPAAPQPEDDVYALYARTRRWKYVLYLQDIHSDLQARRLGISAYTAADWDAFETFDRQSGPKAPLFFQPEFSPREAGQEEIFDLHNDPFELNNLAQSENLGPVRRALRHRVFDWWEATGGGPLPFTPADF